MFLLNKWKKYKGLDQGSTEGASLLAKESSNGREGSTTLPTKSCKVPESVPNSLVPPCKLRAEATVKSSPESQVPQASSKGPLQGPPPAKCDSQSSSQAGQNSFSFVRSPTTETSSLRPQDVGQSGFFHRNTELPTKDSSSTAPVRKFEPIQESLHKTCFINSEGTEVSKKATGNSITGNRCGIDQPSHAACDPQPDYVTKHTQKQATEGSVETKRDCRSRPPTPFNYGTEFEVLTQAVPASTRSRTLVTPVRRSDSSANGSSLGSSSLEKRKFDLGKTRSRSMLQPGDAKNSCDSSLKPNVQDINYATTSTSRDRCNRESNESVGIERVGLVGKRETGAKLRVPNTSLSTHSTENSAKTHASKPSDQKRGIKPQTSELEQHLATGKVHGAVPLISSQESKMLSLGEVGFESPARNSESLLNDSNEVNKRCEQRPNEKATRQKGNADSTIKLINQPVNFSILQKPVTQITPLPFLDTSSTAIMSSNGLVENLTKVVLEQKNAHKEERKQGNAPTEKCIQRAVSTNALVAVPEQHNQQTQRKSEGEFVKNSSTFFKPLCSSLKATSKTSGCVSQFRKAENVSHHQVHPVSQSHTQSSCMRPANVLAGDSLIDEIRRTLKDVKLYLPDVKHICNESKEKTIKPETKASVKRFKEKAKANLHRRLSSWLSDDELETKRILTNITNSQEPESEEKNSKNLFGNAIKPEWLHEYRLRQFTTLKGGNQSREDMQKLISEACMLGAHSEDGSSVVTCVELRKEVQEKIEIIQAELRKLHDVENIQVTPHISLSQHALPCNDGSEKEIPKTIGKISIPESKHDGMRAEANFDFMKKTLKHCPGKELREIVKKHCQRMLEQTQPGARPANKELTDFFDEMAGRKWHYRRKYAMMSDSVSETAIVERTPCTQPNELVREECPSNLPVTSVWKGLKKSFKGIHNVWKEFDLNKREQTAWGHFLDCFEEKTNISPPKFEPPIRYHTVASKKFFIPNIEHDPEESYLEQDPGHDLDTIESLCISSYDDELKEILEKDNVYRALEKHSETNTKAAEAPVCPHEIIEITKDSIIYQIYHHLALQSGAYISQERSKQNEGLIAKNADSGIDVHEDLDQQAEVDEKYCTKEEMSLLTSPMPSQRDVVCFGRRCVKAYVTQKERLLNDLIKSLLKPRSPGRSSGTHPHSTMVAQVDELFRYGLDEWEVELSSHGFAKTAPSDAQLLPWNVKTANQVFQIPEELHSEEDDFYDDMEYEIHAADDRTGVSQKDGLVSMDMSKRNSHDQLKQASTSVKYQNIAPSISSEAIAYNAKAAQQVPAIEQPSAKCGDATTNFGWTKSKSTAPKVIHANVAWSENKVGRQTGCTATCPIDSGLSYKDFPHLPKRSVVQARSPIKAGSQKSQSKPLLDVTGSFETKQDELAVNNKGEKPLACTINNWAFSNDKDQNQRERLCLNENEEILCPLSNDAIGNEDDLIPTAENDVLDMSQVIAFSQPTTIVGCMEFLKRISHAVELKHSKTSSGFTLSDCLVSKQTGSETDMMFAARDSECYAIFEAHLRQLLSVLHDNRIIYDNPSLVQFAPSKTLMKKISQTEDTSKVIDFTVELLRCLERHPFPTACKDRKQAINMDKLLKEACKSLTVKFKGSTSPLSFTDETIVDLINRGILDDTRTDCRLQGATLYKADGGRVVVLLNYSETVRIITTTRHGELNKIFSDAFEIHKLLEEALIKKGNKFAWSPVLGYFNPDPKNIGLAFRLRARICLSKLNETPFQGQILERFDLYKVSQAFHKRQKETVVDVRNKYQFGMSEIEILEKFRQGVKLLVNAELRLEQGQDIADLTADD